jgi:hypothetical protein
MQESSRKLNLRKGLVIFSTLIFAFLVSTTYSLSRRVAELEKTVVHREEADPLKPDECPTDGVVCSTTMDKIIASPKKYHGRKLSVTGLYVSGFETSALYREDVKGELLHSQAIWVNAGLPEIKIPHVVTVVGLFKRGPAGHMDEYMGQLVDVTTIR